MIIDFCKTLAINIFWVLAALVQVLLVAAIIIGILNSLLDNFPHKDGDE